MRNCDRASKVDRISVTLYSNDDNKMMRVVQHRLIEWLRLRAVTAQQECLAAPLSAVPKDCWYCDLCREGQAEGPLAILPAAQ
jgi:hypothetical protein